MELDVFDAYEELTFQEPVDFLGPVPMPPARMRDGTMTSSSLTNRSRIGSIAPMPQQRPVPAGTVSLAERAFACSQGLQGDATWHCSPFPVSHRVCGHMGTLEWASDAYAVREDDRHVRVAVRRSGGGLGRVTVWYEMFYETASAADISPHASFLGRGEAAQQLVFEDGIVQLSFLLELHDDLLVEGNETVLLRLQEPRFGATLGPQARTRITLIDDDRERVSPGCSVVSSAAGVTPTEPMLVNASAVDDNRAPIPVMRSTPLRGVSGEPLPLLVHARRPNPTGTGQPEPPLTGCVVPGDREGAFPVEGAGEWALGDDPGAAIGQQQRWVVELRSRWDRGIPSSSTKGGGVWWGKQSRKSPLAAEEADRMGSAATARGDPFASQRFSQAAGCDCCAEGEKDGHSSVYAEHDSDVSGRGSPRRTNRIASERWEQMLAYNGQDRRGCLRRLGRDGVSFVEPLHSEAWDGSLLREYRWLAAALGSGVLDSLPLGQSLSGLNSSADIPDQPLWSQPRAQSPRRAPTVAAEALWAADWSEEAAEAFMQAQIRAWYGTRGNESRVPPGVHHRVLYAASRLGVFDPARNGFPPSSPAAVTSNQPSNGVLPGLVGIGAATIGPDSTDSSLYAAWLDPLVEGPHDLHVWQAQRGGLRSEWFGNPVLRGNALVARMDHGVNYTWGTGAVIDRQVRGASVRWWGQIELPRNETATTDGRVPAFLYVSGGDGDQGRLWLDDSLVIDRWGRDFAGRGGIGLSTGDLETGGIGEPRSGLRDTLTRPIFGLNESDPYFHRHYDQSFHVGGKDVRKLVDAWGLVFLEPGRLHKIRLEWRDAGHPHAACRLEWAIPEAYSRVVAARVADDARYDDLVVRSALVHQGLLWDVPVGALPISWQSVPFSRATVPHSVLYALWPLQGSPFPVEVHPGGPSARTAPAEATISSRGGQDGITHDAMPLVSDDAPFDEEDRDDNEWGLVGETSRQAWQWWQVADRVDRGIFVLGGGGAQVAGRGLSTARAGEVARFLIFSRDRQGNDRLDYGAEDSFRVIAIPHRVASAYPWNSNTTRSSGQLYSAPQAETGDVTWNVAARVHEVAYELPRTETYLLFVQLWETWDMWTDVVGSPFPVSVLPGAVAASRCNVSGEGIAHAIAGEPAIVAVTARDGPGNLVPVDALRPPEDNASPHFRLQSTPIDDVASFVVGEATPVQSWPLLDAVGTGAQTFEQSPPRTAVPPQAAPGFPIDVDGAEEELMLGERLDGRVLSVTGEWLTSVEDRALFEGTYVPVRAGKSSVFVTWKGTNVLDSPFEVDVEPAATSGFASKTGGPDLQRMEATVPNQIWVQLFDRFGNARGRSVGENVTAVSVPPEPGLTSLGWNSTVSESSDQVFVTIIPRGAGGGVLRVAVDGEELAGSPFPLEIRPGVAVGETSTLTGAGRSRAMAGVLAGVVLHPRDGAGNPTSACRCRGELDDADVVEAAVAEMEGVLSSPACCAEELDVRGWLELVEPAAGDPSRVNASDGLIVPLTWEAVPAGFAGSRQGQWHGVYNATIAGMYVMGVFVNGEPVSGGPWEVFVEANAMDPEATIVVGSGVGDMEGDDVVFAGDLHTVDVFARDAFGNDCERGGEADRLVLVRAVLGPDAVSSSAAERPIQARELLDEWEGLDPWEPLPGRMHLLDDSETSEWVEEALKPSCAAPIGDATSDPRGTGSFVPMRPLVSRPRDAGEVPRDLLELLQKGLVFQWGDAEDDPPVATAPVSVISALDVGNGTYRLDHVVTVAGTAVVWVLLLPGAIETETAPGGAPGGLWRRVFAQPEWVHPVEAGVDGPGQHTGDWFAVGFGAGGVVDPRPWRGAHSATYFPLQPQWGREGPTLLGDGGRVFAGNFSGFVHVADTFSVQWDGWLRPNVSEMLNVSLSVRVGARAHWRVGSPVERVVGLDSDADLWAHDDGALLDVDTAVRRSVGNVSTVEGSIFVHDGLWYPVSIRYAGLRDAEGSLDPRLEQGVVVSMESPTLGSVRAFPWDWLFPAFPRCVWDSPRAVYTPPAESEPLTSEARGEGLAWAVVGERSTAWVRVRDQWDNIRWHGGDRVQVTAVGVAPWRSGAHVDDAANGRPWNATAVDPATAVSPGQVAPHEASALWDDDVPMFIANVTDTGRGLYLVEFVPAVAGWYTVSVTVNAPSPTPGKDGPVERARQLAPFNVAGSPFLLRVSPGNAVAEKSLGFGPALESSLAGEALQFTIHTVDIGGNNRTAPVGWTAWTREELCRLENGDDELARGRWEVEFVVESPVPPVPRSPGAFPWPAPGTRIAGSVVPSASLPGAYDVWGTLKVAGTYRIEVRLDGSQIGDGPWHVRVAPVRSNATVSRWGVVGTDDNQALPDDPAATWTPAGLANGTRVSVSNQTVDVPFWAGDAFSNTRQRLQASRPEPFQDPSDEAWVVWVDGPSDDRDENAPVPGDDGVVGPGGWRALGWAERAGPDSGLLDPEGAWLARFRPQFVPGHYRLFVGLASGSILANAGHSLRGTLFLDAWFGEAVPAGVTPASLGHLSELSIPLEPPLARADAPSSGGLGHRWKSARWEGFLRSPARADVTLFVTYPAYDGVRVSVGWPRETIVNAAPDPSAALDGPVPWKTVSARAATPWLASQLVDVVLEWHRAASAVAEGQGKGDAGAILVEWAWQGETGVLGQRQQVPSTSLFPAAELIAGAPLDIEVVEPGEEPPPRWA